MSLTIKISRVVAILLMVLTLSISYSDALSIEGGSSSYQITGEGQGRVSTPQVSAPKVIEKQKISVPSEKKIVVPVEKKVIRTPSAPVSKPIKKAIAHASAPSSNTTREVIEKGSILSIAVLGNMPIISTVQDTIAKIADEDTTLHASALETDFKFFTLVQYLAFAAFILLAFGLGCIAAPLKR